MSLLPEPTRREPQLAEAPSRFSVYVFTPPNIDFLSGWQMAIVLFGGMAVLWSSAHHLTPVAVIIYSIALAAVRLPTAHRPLQYVRYLCKRIDDRPAVIEPVPTPDGTTQFLFFGNEKVGVGIDTSAVSVASIANFLQLFNAPFELVTTTGCPKGDVVDWQTAILADRQPDTAEHLLNCANQAGLQLKPMDLTLFENSSSNNRASSQFIVEKLPPTVWMNELAHLLRQTKCHYTTIVHIAPANITVAKARARQLLSANNPATLHMIAASQNLSPLMQPYRQGAADLMEGRTKPYDLSIDISLCANEGMQLHLCGAALKHNATKVGITLKHVRTRKLPFSSAFREPPAPYAQTVGQGAVVALCPFFLAL